MRYRGPWRLQEDLRGHGMGIESPLSAERGDPIVWAKSSGDLGFADDEVRNVVLAAPELLASLAVVAKKLAVYEVSAELTTALQLLRRLPSP
jgi:hypothetical protein